MSGAECEGSNTMLAKDIMTPNVITIAPSLGVEQIAQLLLSRNISGVPVVDAEDRLIGHCQTNLSRPAKGADPRRSGRQLPPLGQGGGTVLSEDIAAV